MNSHLLKKKTRVIRLKTNPKISLPVCLVVNRFSSGLYSNYYLNLYSSQRNYYLCRILPLIHIVVKDFMLFACCSPIHVWQMRRRQFSRTRKNRSARLYSSVWKLIHHHPAFQVTFPLCISLLRVRQHTHCGLIRSVPVVINFVKVDY